jgi:hypothetical protein
LRVGIVMSRAKKLKYAYIYIISSYYLGKCEDMIYCGFKTPVAPTGGGTVL